MTVIGDAKHPATPFCNGNILPQKQNYVNQFCKISFVNFVDLQQGIFYLSVIRDLFDNSIVAYKTGTEQNINLVLPTIKEAKKKSLQSCNSTVTKAFNTHLISIPS